MVPSLEWNLLNLQQGKTAGVTYQQAYKAAQLFSEARGRLSDMCIEQLPAPNPGSAAGVLWVLTGRDQAGFMGLHMPRSIP